MTPKDKAKELVEKFENIPMSYAVVEPFIDNHTAKQCALIAVDEIRDVLNKTVNTNKLAVKWDLMFWNEVKTEINKL